MSKDTQLHRDGTSRWFGEFGGRRRIFTLVLAALLWTTVGTAKVDNSAALGMGSCMRKNKYHPEELSTGNPQYDGILPGKEIIMSRKFDRRNSVADERKSLNLGDMLRVDVVQDRIAIVTLLGEENLADPNLEEKFPWGTRRCEHRINPHMISAVNAALDRALENSEISAVVVTGEGKFFSNGMDLKWIDANPRGANNLQKDAEALLARILTFPLPTIAAINGHFCAAGAMLGLAFDFRVMNQDKGLFFVPAVDLGLVYSTGMTELMKAKTPVHFHNDLIVYGTKYTGRDLEKEKVVHQVAPAKDVVPVAVEHARKLTEKGRFGDPKYRVTMERIKQNTYRLAFQSLTSPTVEGMGFESGTWDESGKSKL